MSEVTRSLVSITELDPVQTAERMVGLVHQNHDLLEARDILGPIARYRSLSEAENSIQRLQTKSGGDPRETYGIMDEEQRLQGIATVMTRLALSKLHIPIAPGAAEVVEDYGRKLHIAKLAAPLASVVAHNKVELKFAGPNITAWTDAERPDLLQHAYVSLTLNWRLGNRPWTIESTRSPSHVHEAISASDMQYIKTGRFDDQETKRSVPPRSKLYARLRSQWFTSHGKIRELKTGAKDSLLDTIDEVGRYQGHVGK